MSSQHKQYDLFQPTPEHNLLRKTIASFVKNEVEKQACIQDQKEEFNLALFKKMGSLGFLGITADSKFGGAGMDAVSAVIIHEELSYSDPGFTLAYLAHVILCVHNISQNATEEQKKRWLPKLCSGEWVGAMAMSEAEAGTDVFGMKSNFIQKKEHFILNGRKMWITNGTQDENKTPADCVLLYAQSNKKEISTFIIEKSFEGYLVGQKIKSKLGMRASNTAELIFNDCKIPTNNLIGKPGESLNHMMKNLEIERLTLAAMSLGIAKRCFHEMNKYANQRKAFGKTIRNFGQIQKYLATSYSEYMSCRSYVYNIARTMDFNKSGVGCGQTLHTDSAKLICAKMGKKVADTAIQILGGYGYVGEYNVERFWRDAKLLEIGGGTNEALEKNIAKQLINF